MASSSRLKPGEKGKITVSVDTKGKLGITTKSIQVFTNDPKKPVTYISLTMKIKDRLHNKTFAAKEIFRGECKSCHIERGRGKKGDELFRADCIMCHETGRSAVPISTMNQKPREYLIRAIRDGVANTSMPGWDIKNSGPLSQEEIDSLVSLIKPN